MKKTILSSGVLAVFALVFSMIFANHAFAMQPTLSLSTYNNVVQLTIYGNPYSSVSLEYQGNYGLQNEGVIGTTNSAGYLSTTISPSSYLIAGGSNVFVIINGQQSSYAVWPTLSSSYGATYNGYYPYNTYPTYTTNYTYPTYSNYSYPINYYSTTYTQPLGLSTNSLSLSQGQSQTIQIYPSNTIYNNGYDYGNSDYYISTNQKPNVASASINGSSLMIYATGYGSSNITVCQNSSYNGSSPSCGTVLVTVTNPYQNYNYNNYYNCPPYSQYNYNNNNNYNPNYYGNLSYPIY